jgi:Ca2+-transporting ATPase
MSPFSVIQLLWINLIMDVLAALALGTEAPGPEVKKDRIKMTDNLVLPVMWRTVTSQCLYQALTMIVLLYAGPSMFGIQYNLVSEPLRDANGPTNRLIHYTLMFQCFVMMNLFNMWNCRVLSGEIEKDFNIFAGFWRNWYFLIIFLIELNVQYFMVGYSWVGVIFQTAPLTTSMQVTAICLGLGSWIIAAAVKATPYEWTAIFPQMAEKDDGTDPASKLIARGSQQFHRGETRKLMEGY